MNKQDVISFFDRYTPWWDDDMIRNEDIITTTLREILTPDKRLCRSRYQVWYGHEAVVLPDPQQHYTVLPSYIYSDAVSRQSHYIKIQRIIK